MHRARPYLPAIPYLVGVALQVSGRTHLGLSLAVFGLAALIAAGVTWSYWAEWRQAALLVGHPQRYIQRVLEWPGLKIPRLWTIPAELIAAVFAFLVCTGAIVAFFTLAEVQQAQHVESVYATQLKRFYSELGSILLARLPRDMTPEKYDEWQKQVEAKQEEIIGWVASNMGTQAQLRLVDTHHQFPPRPFSHAINAKHNLLLLATWNMQGNLKEMIETNVWDKTSASQTP